MSTMKMPSKFWMIIVILFFLIPLASSYYKYYYAKNYDFLIEAKCDAQIEICFSRDCANPDNCPPNGLSIYKQFIVKAYDFVKCTDNSCEQECLNKKISCKPILCGLSPDDECTKLPE